MLDSLILASAPNFRDIGGYRGRNGMHLMLRRVFRSERLFSLTDEDLERVRKIRICALYDLRSEGERELHPNRWPDGQAIDEFHGNITSDVRSKYASIFEPLRQNPTASGARAMMKRIYGEMPVSFVPLFGSLLKRIGDGKVPVLVHCTAGKDRTGFAIAILMAILGVEKDGIYAEYLLSGKYGYEVERKNEIRDLIESQIGFSPDDDILEPIVGVNPEYLDFAFEEINSLYGSVGDYLRVACRVDDESIQRLFVAMLA